jgi:transcriptional regulator with XRE-family HTH domain
MTKTVEVIAGNIRRLREIKELSQKEVSAKTKIPQGQYSRIENGKVEPSVSSLEKLAKVFDVSVSEFFRSNNLEDELNLPILEKIKMIDTLAKDEQQAIFKMIDLAISNKKLKENLTRLIAQ